MSHQHTGVCFHEHGRVIVLPRAPFRQGLGPANISPEMREDIASLMPGTDALVQGLAKRMADHLMQQHGILEGRFQAEGDIDLAAWNLAAAMIAWSGAEDSMAIHLYQLANGALPPLKLAWSDRNKHHIPADLIVPLSNKNLAGFPGPGTTFPGQDHVLEIGVLTFQHLKMDEESKDWEGEVTYSLWAYPLPAYREELWGRSAPPWTPSLPSADFVSGRRRWTPLGYHPLP